MKIKLILFLIIVSVIGVAQIPAGYYNSAQGLTGLPLKVALHNIIKNHTTVSYSGLWNTYKKTDRKPNGKVWDIYSDIPGGTPPYSFTFSTDQCGSYSVEGDCYNREHSWPQSWFNSVSGPVSDMFHIYPTDGKVNGIRSNYPYGNVSSASYTTLNGGKLGACSNLGYSGTVFEPIDDYKGDLARGYFYMSTRYYTEDASWSSSAATNKATILPWQVNVLLQWHHQDPVSAKEIARNDTIYYHYQHNRNPFIDNPQWVDSIWQQDVSVFIKENTFKPKFSIFPNPTNEQLTIVNELSSNIMNVDLKLMTINGEIIEDRKLSFSGLYTIDCVKLPNGIYFIQLITPETTCNLKFVKSQ